jgi:hypothetical protein
MTVLLETKVRAVAATRKAARPRFPAANKPQKHFQTARQ